MRALHTFLVGTPIATALALLTAAAPAAGANKACGLVTPSELEALVGGSLALRESNAGDVQICMGQTPRLRVMLRLFKRTDDLSGAKEKAGIEALKQMGAQVDVKTFGPITCTAVIPAANLAEHGFGTTCSVRKTPMFAVVEVTATAQKDMVPIEKLKSLAEKMASRF